MKGEIIKTEHLKKENKYLNKNKIERAKNE